MVHGSLVSIKHMLILLLHHCGLGKEFQSISVVAPSLHLLVDELEDISLKS